MSGPAQVIILGEDSAHVGSFYRAVVDHLAVPRGKVRKCAVPGGKGDAKRYIHDEMPKEVGLLRRGPNSAVLIVIMDSDGASEEQRLKELVDGIADPSGNLAELMKRVAVMVPRRNIETWLEFARCSSVDEEADYKRGRRSSWSSADLALVGGAIGMSPAPKSNPPSSLEKARDLLRAKLDVVL